MLFEADDIEQVHWYFHYFKRRYPENTIRINYFLACCYHIDKHIDADEIILDCPHGGLIGIGDSRLEIIFGNFKLFRLHAALHDASGYMKDKFDAGPGYVYCIFTCPKNSCFLGHVTGLLFCTYLKFFKGSPYNNLSI
jgi:hypothetical protein